MNELQLYILLFFIYSVIGWIVEVILIFVEYKKVVNRGFLIGPYLPIFGIGGVLITLFLSEYSSNPVLVFFASIIISGSVEYFISFLMEKMFSTRWWDYSHKKFNINGRVAGFNLLCFGVGSLLLIYIINPFLIDKINLIGIKLLKIVNLVLLTIFIFDFILTMSILFKIKKRVKLTIEDSTEKINEIMKKELLKSSKLIKRLVVSFPDFKVLYKKLNKKIKIKKI